MLSDFTIVVPVIENPCLESFIKICDFLSFHFPYELIKIRLNLNPNFRNSKQIFGLSEINFRNRAEDVHFRQAHSSGEVSRATVHRQALKQKVKMMFVTQRVVCLFFKENSTTFLSAGRMKTKSSDKNGIRIAVGVKAVWNSMRLSS